MTKEWERWRNTILGLYKGEGKTLAQTMKTMDEEHGFKASTRAYRSRLRRWDISKYNVNSSRRQSAPSGSATRPPPALPVAMAPSVSYPGASAEDSTETRPSTGSSHDWSPYSSYGDIHSPASAVSPPNQNHFNQSYQYFGQPVQQQQQHRPQQEEQQQQQPGQYSPLDRVHSPLGQQQVNNYLSQDRGQNRPPSLPLPYSPVPQSHNVQLDANDNVLTAFYSLLSPHSPPSSSMEAETRVELVKTHIRQLATLGRLDERGFGATGLLTGLTAFELCIQNVASKGFLFHYWRLFCSLCASFVQHGADVGKFVPVGFADTVFEALQLGKMEIIQQVLDRHRQQQPRAVGDVPLWIAVWISACMQSLGGNGDAVDNHLIILHYFNTGDLRTLLPANCPNTSNGWQPCTNQQ